MAEIIFIGALKNKKKDKSLGGLFTACNALSSALKKNGIKVVELNTTYGSKSVGDSIPLLKKGFVLISRCLNFIYSIFIHKEAKKLYIFLSAGNSYLDKIPSIITAKFLKKDIIIFPRSGFLLRDYENKNYRRIINFAFKNAKLIVCQSVFWQEYFMSNGVPREKLLVIENWVSDKKIQESKKLPFQDPHINDSDVFKILFVSRIEEAKGINDLIEASTILKEKNIKFHVTIYGDGTYSSKLIKDIKARNLDDHVSFKGWLGQDDKYATINSHQLAVFTSRFEGYPNSLLDFIFSKLPVISTNIDSIKAVGGSNMVYYPPGDYKELSEAILWSRSNYQEMVIKSKNIYDEKCINNNLNNSIKKLLQLFN